jgi:predicted transcriptional regulator
MTKQQSAVSPKKPIFQDYIICLEDGCKPQDVEAAYKIILRYVADDYRQRQGLSAKYPMVAFSYAKWCSVLAKQIALGRRSLVIKRALKALKLRSQRCSLKKYLYKECYGRIAYRASVH